MVINDRSPKGFTLIELLITVAIIGIITSIAIPNLLGAIERARQKRTMADLRSIATAVESYSVDLTLYPVATSMAALTPLIEPVYINNPPTDDGWGALTKHPGEEGSSRSLILSLLVDHCLLLHPDQLAQVENKRPVYTVGSLRDRVQVESQL